MYGNRALEKNKQLFLKEEHSGQARIFSYLSVLQLELMEYLRYE
jgi:hypothetical protein